MKHFKRILLGCLGLFLLAIVAIIVTVGVMLSLGPPEQHPEESTSTQPLETPSLPPAADPAPGEVSMPPVSLVVRLDLSEGKFRVKRGNPGEGIRIDAKYDSGVYALEQEHQPGADGEEVVTIRFYSKYSILRRLLTLGPDVVEHADNRIDIYLPPDVPMKLQGSVSMGESDLDLSGLPMTGLDMSLTSGEHRVSFDDPNPLGMEELRLYLSRGEFTAIGLGNAHFQTADIQGSMGEVTVDLTGDYFGDASATTRFRMGEMRVSVPDDIHVIVRDTGVVLGGLNKRIRERDDIPAGAPTLELRSSMSMGELTIRSR